MPRRFVHPLALALVLPAATAACDTSPRERLQGRWVGDHIENFPPAHITRAAGWASSTALEFRGSRATVTIPAESPRTGKFEIKEASADEIMVSFTRPHEGGVDEVAFQFEGDKILHWKLAGGRRIVLRKVDD